MSSQDDTPREQTSFEEPREQTPPEETREPSVGGAVRDFFVKFGKAAWAFIKQAKVELIVLVAVVIVDLVTKFAVAETMTEGQSIELIPSFLYITYVKNTKAAFGKAFGLEKVLGDDGIRIVFLVVTVIAVGVFCYLLYRLRKRHFLMRLSIALIIAGAVGNFIDRAVLRHVRDFIEFVFFGCDVPLLGKSFPVFNVADIALTVGVLLFLVYFIAIYREPKEGEPSAAPAQAEAMPESAAPAQEEESSFSAPTDGEGEEETDMASDAEESETKEPPHDDGTGHGED